MAQAPQFLTLEEHRDNDHLVVRGIRWTVMSLIAALALAAVAGVIGQRTDASVVSGGGARLEVAAPSKLRGGLFYQGRFTIRADDGGIDKATLVLHEGWTENMHINTIEPTPVGESSRDGLLALDFGHVPAGGRVVAYVQFQVNPTNVGRRSQTVELYDDTTLLATADRTVTVFP